MALGRDAALSLGGVLVQGAARFCTILLVGHLAGKGAVGGVSGGISLATLGSLTWPTSAGMGASKFVPREAGGGREAQSRAVAGHLARRTALSMLVIVPLGVLYAAVAYHWTWPRLLCVGLLIVGFSGYNLVRGLQMGRQAVATATTWESVSAGVSLSLLVGVLLGGWDEWLLLPLALGYGAYAAAGWPRGAPPVERELAREADEFVAWGVLGTVSSTGLLQLTMVVCATVLTAHEAGAYGVALSLATPASMVARSFSMVLFPSMARSVGAADLATLRRQTDLSTWGLAATMVPVFGLVCLLADPLLLLLYGKEFLDAAGLMSILTIASLATTLNVAAVNALTASSRRGIRAAASMSTVGLVLGCAAMAVLAPWLRGTGVAASYLIGSCIIGALPMVLVARRQQHRWAGLAVRAVLCGAVALGGALWAQDRGGWLPHVAAVGVFLVVWAGCFGRRVPGIVAGARR